MLESIRSTVRAKKIDIILLLMYVFPRYCYRAAPPASLSLPRVNGTVTHLPSRTGSAANYIIPAVLNLSLLRRGGTKRGLLSEATLNKAIIVFGVLFMIAGTASVFQQAGSHGGESHAKVA